MSVLLSYGRTGLMVDLPSHALPHIVRKPTMTRPKDPKSAVIAALDNPLGAPLISDLARGGKTACILICDITRPVPNHLFLRPLIERLIAAGIPEDGISILVATGLHRPNIGTELAEVIGDAWVIATTSIENHDARDESSIVHLGTTSTHKCPVGLNRRFVEADVKIATGLVEPHFMAGYSGGRKVIAPGVAHHETIRTFHSARFMEHPLAASCQLAGNPLHETQLEIVEMLDGPVLGLNTVIDEYRNLAFVSFGEIVESHMEAVAFARKSCEIAAPQRFKTVVTSAAGHPLDKTYYQTVKSMVTPLGILAEGGTLIIASECSEGLGSSEFRQAQERLVTLGPDRFLETLSAKSLADIDEWQTEMQLKPMRVGDIQLYAPQLGDDHALTGVTQIDNVSAAIQSAIQRYDDPDVAVIPEGPYVVPFITTST